MTNFIQSQAIYLHAISYTISAQNTHYFCRNKRFLFLFLLSRLTELLREVAPSEVLDTDVEEVRSNVYVYRCI